MASERDAIGTMKGRVHALITADREQTVVEVIPNSGSGVARLVMPNAGSSLNALKLGDQVEVDVFRVVKHQSPTA